MRSSLIKTIFFIIHVSLLISVVRAYNGFTWRGNVLKLKRDLFITGQEAPLKVDTKVTYLEDDVHVLGTYGIERPLLPVEKPAFPGHKQVVFANEMKFRELMIDTQSVYSNEFIRCYVDESGGVERVGLLCRVIESKSFNNGEAVYMIEMLSTIQIDGMTVKPGRSYLSSTKTQPLEEELVAEVTINENENLCLNIFTQHKIFFRLAKLLVSYEANKSGDKNLDTSYLNLTPVTISNRPGQDDFETSSPRVKNERHRDFSYSIANRLLSAGYYPPDFHQAMLTSSTTIRLTGDPRDTCV